MLIHSSCRSWGTVCTPVALYASDERRNCWMKLLDCSVRWIRSVSLRSKRSTLCCGHGTTMKQQQHTQHHAKARPLSGTVVCCTRSFNFGRLDNAHHSRICSCVEMGCNKKVIAELQSAKSPHPCGRATIPVLG